MPTLESNKNKTWPQLNEKHKSRTVLINIIIPCNVSSGTLNSTHTLTHYVYVTVCNLVNSRHDLSHDDSTINIVSGIIIIIIIIIIITVQHDGTPTHRGNEAS